MRAQFISALEQNQAAFGVDLSDEDTARLADFFQTVQDHNPLLHLVAPCSPNEFAVRHVLESLTLLAHLPQNTRFADVGTGAGLPAIPCLLVRQDLYAVLIESKVRKAEYLSAAVQSLGLSGRAVIVNRQFEEVQDEQFSAVTCRALDKFSAKLPRLLKWSKGRDLLLFGGPSLGEALAKKGVKFDKLLLPLSEQRFLFVVRQ